jgi:hypothetical protein
MKKKYVLFPLLLATLCLDCKQTPTESTPDGTYSYTGYDSSGEALVYGWFTMDLSDSNTITGEWHFTPIGNPQYVGPQTGDGVLVGGINSGRIWLELNPQLRDNNIGLTGTMENGRYAGEWIWTGDFGIINQGKFEALRK